MLSSNSAYPSRNATLRRLKNAFSSSVLSTSESGAEVNQDSHQIKSAASNGNFKPNNAVFAFGLYSVVLSDSIRSLDYLSPGLYHWIHSGDYSPKGYIRFYSPSGLLIKDGIPKHLTEPYTSESIPPPPRHALTTEEQMFNVNAISRGAAETMRKQTRYVSTYFN